MPRNRDYDYDDEDDEDDEPRKQLEGEALVRHLRKEIKARDKQLNDLSGKLDTFLKNERRTSVESVLKGAEVDPRYARWIVRDLDDQEPTKEAIEKWLEDNADLVGLQAPPASTVGEDTQNSLRKIQNAEKGGKGPDVDPIAAKLTSADLTPADLEAILGKSLNV